MFPLVGTLWTWCGEKESLTGPGSPQAFSAQPLGEGRSTLNFAELIESAMYLYRATGDPTLLELGRDAVESIEKISKVECGFATVSVSTGPRIGKCLPLLLKSLWNISTGRNLRDISNAFIL